MYIYRYIQNIYIPTYCRFDGLLTGVTIAALYNYSPLIFANLSKYANGLITFGIFILTVCYFLFGNDYSFSRTFFGYPLVSLGFGFLVLGAIMPNSFLYKWKSAVLTKIAELSYALYLIHMAVILSTQTIFAELGITKNSNLMFLLSII